MVPWTTPRRPSHRIGSFPEARSQEDQRVLQLRMKLSPSQVARRLAALAGWNLEGDAIVRQYTFPSFPDAVAFAARLAFSAEAADHHPDLLISYKRVTVTWSTHSEGGVTTKDVDGARESDRIARAFLKTKARD